MDDILPMEQWALKLALNNICPTNPIENQNLHLNTTLHIWRMIPIISHRSSLNMQLT